MLILQNYNWFRKREKRLLISNLGKPLMRLSSRSNLLMNVNRCNGVTYHHDQFVSHIGRKYELNHQHPWID
jgi:hypothetical protein